MSSLAFVFRADASNRIGTGHVTRCATLAQVLLSRGAHVTFVCREHHGHLMTMLASRGFDVRGLPAPVAPEGTGDEDYAQWLGVSEAEDAAQTTDALGGLTTDWLVVDHYGLGLDWEQRMRPVTRRLLVIDDLANRAHDCDLLLDQNYPAAGTSAHAGSIPAGHQVLQGPSFALLAPEFAQARHARSARGEDVRRVFVYFGGVDAADMTRVSLEVLSLPEFCHLDADVVIGVNNVHAASIRSVAASRPRTQVHPARPHLADLIGQADVAIGAGGVTTWERLCVGVPSVVVSLAENQRPACEALSDADLIEYVGAAGDVHHDALAAGVRRLVTGAGRRASLSRRGRQLVDGAGASRVADVLTAPADDPVRIRHRLHTEARCPEGFDHFAFLWIDQCRAQDVLSIRNQPHVLTQMRSTGRITDAEHQRFLQDYSTRERYDFILVDTSCNRYVGAFYVTGIAEVPEIGKYIGDQNYLGKGVALRAMQSVLAYCRVHTGLRRLAAVTRATNARNIALNEALGFTRTGRRGDYLVMGMDL